MMKAPGIRQAAAIVIVALALTTASANAAAVAMPFVHLESPVAAMDESAAVSTADAASADSVAVPAPTLAPPPVIVSSPEPAPPGKPGVAGRARRAVGNFFSDGWTIIQSPFRARGAMLAAIGVTLGIEAVLFANDQEVHDAIVRNRNEPFVGDVLDVGETLEPVGFMGKTNPFYAAALVAGYALDVRPLRTIPTQILESHMLAGGVRNLGKLLVGRRHPYDNLGPYEFDFAHGTSFPSGHTSVVFELATIATMNTHSVPVGIVAYSLASAVALQRIESGNHWPSDVFISAAYGTFVSRMVVKLHQQREAGRETKTSLMPHFSDDGRLIGLAIQRKF